jgi:hypothetical protein
MKRWGIFGVILVVLSVAMLPATASGRALSRARFGGFGTSFKLQGTEGYDLWVSAYSRRRDGKGWISIWADGKHAAASYRAPARVTGEPARDGTATAIKADLGALGKVDLLLERSGVEKTVRWKCGGPKWSYEPGIYRGVFEFEGEGGYTGATATEVPLDPMPFFLAGGCHGGGSGESRGPGIPGALLKGISFAHDRILVFQVNKNNRQARTFYSASVREQHEGVYIYRTIEGSAGPSAFSFDRELESATLSPPSPFTGTGTLRRKTNALLPTWNGNLELAFPGHTIPLAGPSVHVSIQHARLTHNGSSTVAIGI